MLMTDYTAEFLNLEDVIITNVENISDQLHIHVELPRKNHICPCCGRNTDRVHDYRRCHSCVWPKCRFYNKCWGQAMSLTPLS